MKEKTNSKILMIAIIATLLIAVIGATYAYFKAQEATQKTLESEVMTTSGDSAAFEVEGELKINANLTNFAIDKGDESSSEATGKVVFRAAQDVAEGSDMCYKVAVNVVGNNFTYSKDENTPELVLEVIHGDDKIEENISYGTDKTLKYVTVAAEEENTETGYKGRETAISGYDVTTLKEKVYIQEGNRSYFKAHADAGATIEDDWTFKIHFINYDFDQSNVENANNNGEKGFTGLVIFEQIDCVTYAVVSGGGTGVYYSEESDASIKVDGDLEKFERLLLNNEVVSTSNYTLESGSTIAKIKKDYIRTLDNGTYNLTFVYSDGEVAADFQVKKSCWVQGANNWWGKYDCVGSTCNISTCHDGKNGIQCTLGTYACTNGNTSSQGEMADNYCGRGIGVAHVGRAKGGMSTTVDISKCQLS